MLKHLLTRLTLCAALAAGCLVPASAVAQQVKPEYPRIVVPTPPLPPNPGIPPGLVWPSGERALRIIGPVIGVVSRWYGFRAEQIVRSFLELDPMRQFDWFLDNNGRIVLNERALTVQITPPGQARPTLRQLFPDDMTLRLHSNPKAKVKIWLAYKPFADTIPWPQMRAEDPYILQNVWDQVAEDFAPFDVDVTTERPSESDFRRSGPGDDRYGVLVSIEKDSAQAPHAQGTVYLNSFDDFDDSRRTIEIKLPKGEQDPAVIAHFASHLLGHALGLPDDEYREGSYVVQYRGLDWPQNSWVPIMGRPTNASVTQFSQGDFPGALERTDSIARIAQTVPLRPDDAGDTVQTATGMSEGMWRGSVVATADGVIGRQGDVDVYALTPGGGLLAATIRPSTTAPNTNLVVKLLDQSGNVLSTRNAWDADLQYLVPRRGETYFLQVSSTETYGRAYGSLGGYRLQATFAPNSGLRPNASLMATPVTGNAPLSVRLDASNSYDDGEVKFVYWDFGDGTGDNSGTRRTYDKIYSRPGIYQVTVTVVDDEGFKSTSTQTITVNAPSPPAVTAKVDLGLINVSSSTSAAIGSLFVVDQTGKRMPSASVRYSWSGLQQGQRSIISQAQGSTVMSLPSSQKGCFILTVTGITLAGYTYDSKSPVTQQVCR